MTDAELIDHLGGPSKVAELLCYDKSKGGAQRVWNWKARGIPPEVKLERPDLFLPGLVQGAQSSAVAAQGGGDAQ